MVATEILNIGTISGTFYLQMRIWPPLKIDLCPEEPSIPIRIRILGPQNICVRYLLINPDLAILYIYPSKQYLSPNTHEVLVTS
jgi:hypothetical protein